MKTTVSSKGQIALPAEIGHRTGSKPVKSSTSNVSIAVSTDSKRRSAPRNESVVDWLLACPEKGFFLPIDSESTDTL
jgi:hypothetical protein